MMTSWNPLISIVVPTRNRTAILFKAIDSLIKQTYQNFEIIIVDDASSDETVNFIQQIKSIDPRIRVVRSEENIGPGGARNMGIANSMGSYIAFLDDDDIAHPNRLALQLETMVKNPNIGLVFSLVEVVDGEYQTIRIHPKLLSEGNFPQEPEEVFKLIYTDYCYIPNTTLFIRKEALGDIRYIEDHWLGEDWYLILQLSAKGVRMLGINKPLAKLYRAENRAGLLTSIKANQYKHKIQLLKKMRAWLKLEGITDFDSYYRIALSNRYIYGSQNEKGVKGLFLCIWGMMLYPKNQVGRIVLKSRLRGIFTKSIGLMGVR